MYMSSITSIILSHLIALPAMENDFGKISFKSIGVLPLLWLGAGKCLQNLISVFKLYVIFKSKSTVFLAEDCF